MTSRAHFSNRVMTSEVWLNPDSERRMWDLDDALSNVMKPQGISHYTIPFKDRPEIAILFAGTQALKKKVLDQH